MNWQEVCSNPDLQNLPFKIELNERGQIIMSPVRIYHSIFASEIDYLLRTHTGEGKTLSECAIETKLGTKVADVAWCSPKRLQKIRHEMAASIAPEICVEVLSSSNTKEEMEEKRALYFEQGAKEVWLCDKNGDMSFYNSNQKLKTSTMIPNFPLKIDI